MPRCYNITVSLSCPACESVIEIEVNVGEHRVDIDQRCPDCGHCFTTAERDNLAVKAECSAIAEFTELAEAFRSER